jgi:large subunit ribosomal protein L15
MPKRGFHNRFRIENRIVNLADLSRVYKDKETVDAASLLERGLIKSGKTPIKVLGNGDIAIALSVKVDKYSKTAIEKIQAAGGSVEEL